MNFQILQNSNWNSQVFTIFWLIEKIFIECVILYFHLVSISCLWPHRTVALHITKGTLSIKLPIHHSRFVHGHVPNNEFWLTWNRCDVYVTGLEWMEIFCNVIVMSFRLYNAMVKSVSPFFEHVLFNLMPSENVVGPNNAIVLFPLTHKR